MSATGGREGAFTSSAAGHLRDAAGRSTRSRSVELYCIRQLYVEVATGRGAAIGDRLGSNPSLEAERFLLLLRSASFSIFLHFHGETGGRSSSDSSLSVSRALFSSGSAMRLAVGLDYTFPVLRWQVVFKDRAVRSRRD